MEFLLKEKQKTKKNKNMYLQTVNHDKYRKQVMYYLKTLTKTHILPNQA